MIVASLLHDIGDEIAPLNHSEISAAVLRPFVSENSLDSSTAWSLSSLLL